MSIAARLGLLFGVVLIPLVGGAVAWAVVTADDHQRETTSLAAAELARLKEEAASKAAERARKADQAERQLRQFQVKDLEKTITKDAQRSPRSHTPSLTDRSLVHSAIPTEDRSTSAPWPRISSA